MIKKLIKSVGNLFGVDKSKTRLEDIEDAIHELQVVVLSNRVNLASAEARLEVYLDARIQLRHEMGLDESGAPVAKAVLEAGSYLE